MDEDIPLPFDLPTITREKVGAAFDRGRISHQAGIDMSNNYDTGRMSQNLPIFRLQTVVQVS
jgi:hypothetical protein